MYGRLRDRKVPGAEDVHWTVAGAFADQVSSLLQPSSTLIMSLRIVATVGWTCLALNALVVLVILVTRNSGNAGALSRDVALILGLLVIATAFGLFVAQRADAPAGIWLASAAAALPWAVLLGAGALSVLGAGEQLLKGGARHGFADERLDGIVSAMARGDTARVRVLAGEPGVSLDAVDDRGATVLRHAVLRATSTLPHAAEAVDAVRILAKAGASIDPEHFAALAVSDYTPLPLLEALLQGGADPEAGAPFTDEPLVFHAGLGAAKLELLVRYGADVHRLHPGPGPMAGWTTLMVAARNGAWDAAILFLEHGVTPDHRAPDGTTLTSILAAGEETPPSSADQAEARRRLAAAVAARR